MTHSQDFRFVRKKDVATTENLAWFEDLPILLEFSLVQYPFGVWKSGKKKKLKTHGFFVVSFGSIHCCHLASVEYPPPEGHSSVINAETSVGASGSALWQKIRDRWRARRAERETKTHQTAAWRDEGRRDDELGAEGICQGRQQEHGREATQRRPQDALRALSASEGSQRRSLHVLDDQARGARVQETERAIARLLGTGGDQGKGSRTGLLQALLGRGSTVGAASAAGVANLKQTWDDMEPEGAFDLVPHCKLAKVYDPALSRLELVISVAQHREHIREVLGQTRPNRLLGQAPSGALERAMSATIEQN